MREVTNLTFPSPLHLTLLTDERKKILNISSSFYSSCNLMAFITFHPQERILALETYRGVKRGVWTAILVLHQT